MESGWGRENDEGGDDNGAIPGGSGVARWHGVIGAVILASLLIQLVLIFSGGAA